MARDPSVFVHEKGLCESDDVGARTRVWAFAHVMRGAVVGSDCNIGDHAFIEQGARIGDRVTVKNAVLVWDGVTVEDEVFLGPNMVFTNVRDLRAALRPRPDVRALAERPLVDEHRRIARHGQPRSPARSACTTCSC